MVPAETVGGPPTGGFIKVLYNMYFFALQSDPSPIPSRNRPRAWNRVRIGLVAADRTTVPTLPSGGRSLWANGLPRKRGTAGGPSGTPADIIRLIGPGRASGIRGTVGTAPAGTRNRGRRKNVDDGAPYPRRNIMWG